MTEQSRVPLELIESLRDLERAAAKLAGYRHVAVDLEADSFYTYHPKTCLIQLSVPDHDFIVDPLAVKDLSPLGPMFRDPGVEKVFHAAEYDLQCLKRDCGFEISPLFDTLAAARLLGEKELGLAALISKYFDVKLSKKLQRSDWGKRPLSQAQLEYARMDTHYLLPLRDILYEGLETAGLLEDAEEEFARLERMERMERAFDPDDFWRLPGARNLSPQGRAVLKELYFFREKTAAETDKAPFRVLPEPLLVRLADRLPTDLDALEGLDGMTPYLFRRFGAELLEVIRKGLSRPPIESQPQKPRREGSDPGSLRRYQALREWRKAKAQQRGVDSVVILGNEELKALASGPERSQQPAEWLSPLGPRKRELFGEELLRLLSAQPQASAGRKRRRRRRRGGGTQTPPPPPAAS